MKKAILSIISFSFLFGLLFNLNHVKALEEVSIEGVSIYDYSYGEILEMTDKDLYDTLSEDEKNYFEKLPAKDVLGENTQESSQDEVIYDTIQTNSYTRESNLILVYTQAKLSRKNSKTLTYGGIYTSTYPIKLKGYAYLIRKSDGRIMKSASCSADATVGKTLSKDASITEGDEKYYCRAVGIFTTKTMGSKTTSQSTISYH